MIAGFRPAPSGRATYADTVSLPLVYVIIFPGGAAEAAAAAASAARIRIAVFDIVLLLRTG
jgi:hypothetical protein